MPRRPQWPSQHRPVKYKSRSPNKRPFRKPVPLSDEQVQAIKDDPRSDRDIAHDYDISLTLVYRIKTGSRFIKKPRWP